MTRILKDWQGVLSFIAAITATIFIFLSFPKFLNYESHNIIRLSQFICTGLFLIFFFGTLKSRIIKLKLLRILILIALLCASLFFIYKYWIDTEKFSVPYASGKTRVIVGSYSQINTVARAQMKKIEEEAQRNFQIKDFLQMNAYNANDFWDKAILDRTFFMLTIEYLLAVVFTFLFVILSIVSIKKDRR